MKYLIVSDMHGESPVDCIQREIKENGIGKLVCLGDYDTPEVLREIRKIRIPKILTVGNHDLHYVYELGISSPIMKLSAPDYADLWNNNPQEKEFIEDAIAGRKKNAGLIVEANQGGRKIAYAHASLVDAGSPDSDVYGYVWQRLYTEEAVVMNFAKMIQENYWILFRGHDMGTSALALNKDKKIEYPNGEKIMLEPEKRYIITTGEFYYGNYVVFDSKEKTIEFKNTGTGNPLRGI